MLREVEAAAQSSRCLVHKRLPLGPIAEMESVSIIKVAARLSAGQGTACPARTSAQLGAFYSARSEVGCEMWRDEAWRGRAGQASEFGEPAWWTGPPPFHSSRATAGHDRMARLQRRSSSRGTACGYWTSAWSNASPLTNEPAS